MAYCEVSFTAFKNIGLWTQNPHISCLQIRLSGNPTYTFNLIVHLEPKAHVTEHTHLLCVFSTHDSFLLISLCCGNK